MISTGMILLSCYIGSGFGSAFTIWQRLHEGRIQRKRLAPDWIPADDWAIALSGLLWPLWVIYLVAQRVKHERRRKHLNG